jgi:DNA-binding response OmpR family regulator
LPARSFRAIRAVQTEQPDLIVLDLMLPGMSGLEVLADLRRREETRDIPVILLTARREDEDRIEGLRLGADGDLAKPFSPQELVLRVGAVLRRVQQQPPCRRWRTI